MIVLTVLSYNGERAQGPAAQFDELGGTIGRADNNQLVLPDPERTISRVHARIVYRAGRFAIVDNGSNPISINGVPAGAGREQVLKPGDQVQIGGYLLEVQEGTVAAASGDPFADLFGDAAMGLAAPGRAPAAPLRPAPVAPPPAPAPPMPAPRPAPAPVWPAPTPAPASSAAAWSTPPPPAAPRAAPSLANPIPEDWDPFAPDAAAAPAAPAPVLGGDPVLGVSLARRDTLDDLFGLADAPAGTDPFGASGAAALLQPPNTAGDDDPLSALNRTATLMPPTHGDLGSELNTPMLLGREAPPPGPAEPAAMPEGAVFSWDETHRDGRIVTPAGSQRGPAPAPTPARARATPGPAAVPTTALDVATPAAAPKVPAPAPRASLPPQDASPPEALLAALLEGLGVPGLRLQALTPETMQLLGQLLRESTRGAVELLGARAALKREMRAEVTMIVARENNPLKFSPTVEVALGHLLGPPAPGFMLPVPAVRDAFDDLRAHQLGVMAGMRAALEGVLLRFDPQQLEGKLTRKSTLSNLIPGARKARLWELFQELFSQLQSEAQDDFDELFGKAFLRAYEQQLDRLQREPGPR